MIRTFGLAVILTCFVLSLFASDQIASRVDQILAEANIHDPRPVAKSLAKLGKPAVPYLIQKLNSYSHPDLIVEALGRIGDKNAVLPLLAFLNKQDLTVKKDILLTKSILKTLTELNDPSAEAPLLAILRNEKNLTEVRLYAATTLSKIGSGKSNGEASDFILNSPLLAGGKVSPIDLDSAYFELGTKEAMNKLFAALRNGLGYEQLFIIDLLAERTTLETNEILLKVSENKTYFPEVRLRAVEALVRRQNIPTERLLAALHSLKNDVPEDSGRLVSKQAVQQLIDRVLKDSKK